MSIKSDMYIMYVYVCVYKISTAMYGDYRTAATVSLAFSFRHCAARRSAARRKMQA